jgi:hypothetical protein
VRRASFALFFALASCGDGTDPPATVEDEVPAIDIRACATGSGCTTSGEVFRSEVLVPGDDDALRIMQGGSISAPLTRPYDGRLRYLALGLFPEPDASIVVEITGSPPQTVKPLYAWLMRVELQTNDVHPPAGATITIRAAKGNTNVLWAVGRWAH